MEALTGDQSFLTESVRSYRLRRDLSTRLLGAVPGLEPVVPQGAFYLFVNCAALIGKQTPGGTVIE
ncbi:aspartate transaminase, partial [Klebsiella pneumoniae]